MVKAAPKTKVGNLSPEAFLSSIEPTSRRQEAERLIRIFAEVSGARPKVWHGMFGFGQYEYRYASGRSGTIFATGFAMRKAEIVLYVLHGDADYAAALADLGPHRVGKSCVYLKRLDGMSETALRRLIRQGLDNLALLWPVSAG